MMPPLYARKTWRKFNTVTYTIFLDRFTANTAWNSQHAKDLLIPLCLDPLCKSMWAFWPPPIWNDRPPMWMLFRCRSKHLEHLSPVSNKQRGFFSLNWIKWTWLADHCKKKSNLLQTKIRNSTIINQVNALHVTCIAYLIAVFQIGTPCFNE